MSQRVVRMLMALFVCGVMAVPMVAFAAENAHPEAAEAAHAAAAHEAGLPMTWQRDLALFSVITFVCYVLVLRMAAWEPLKKGLNDATRIRQEIADATANQQKSEALLKDYEQKLAKAQEEVRDILAEARRDAEHARQEIAATAQKEAEATKQRAIAEIERSRDQALGELFDFVSNNVVGATEKVIGRSLTGADQERLVSDALSQMNVRRN